MTPYIIAVVVLLILAFIVLQVVAGLWIVYTEHYLEGEKGTVRGFFGWFYKK